MKLGDLVTHSDRYTNRMESYDIFYSRKVTGLIIEVQYSAWNLNQETYRVLWDDGTTFSHDERELKVI